MYYPPPLFAPMRPFETRPNPLEGAPPSVDVPVAGPGTRENPLDLSVKNIRQNPDNSVDGEELLMLEHRKLASLAASHTLSAMGRQLAPGSAAAAAALLDPTLYRLAYGPEALLPSPFCYDRATGVAVPTSLAASHQLMSSFLQQQQQQRDRCLEQQQQQALLAARSSAAAAQQAAVAAALMDPASLSLGLGGAVTQREAAAALAATRGLYPPALAGPVVLPGFPLYPADDKGAYASLRNGTTDKNYLNGTAAALEAARFAEHLQRLREQHLQQAGKCGSSCCTTAGLSGLVPTTVPCACCVQSPSQAALCARSLAGCAAKDPSAAAAVPKTCSATGDYLQSGLTFLHRPATVVTSTSQADLKLPVTSLCTSTAFANSTVTASSGPSFQPVTSWTTSLPGSSASGKTAFSVPKKKDSQKDSTIQKEVKIVNGSKDIYSSNATSAIYQQDAYKRDHDKPITTTCSSVSHPVAPAITIKKEPTTRGTDVDYVARNDVVVGSNGTFHGVHRKEHDVKSILSPSSGTSSVTPYLPRSAGYSHSHAGPVAQTTVTAVTPIVPTKCEGGTIPKTKMPPTLQPFRPVEPAPQSSSSSAYSAEKLAESSGGPSVPQRSAPSPQGPPPLIAVGRVSSQSQKNGAPSLTSVNGISRDSRMSYSSTDVMALRHQALLHNSCPSTFQKISSAPSASTTSSSSEKFSIVDIAKSSQKSSSKNNSSSGFCPGKTTGSIGYIKEEPGIKPTPPTSIPKPIPQVPVRHPLGGAAAQFASPFLPYSFQGAGWMPPGHAAVTMSHIPRITTAAVTTAVSSVCTTASSSTTGVSTQSMVKSEPVPVIKRELDYSYSNNVLQSLLVRPSGPGSGTSSQQQSSQASTSTSNSTTSSSVATGGAAAAASTTAAQAALQNARSVIIPNPTMYPFFEYQYHHMVHGLNSLNLSHGPGPVVGSAAAHVSSTASEPGPTAATTVSVSNHSQKIEPKMEYAPVHDTVSKVPKKRPSNTVVVPSTSVPGAAVTSTTAGAAVSTADSSLASTVEKKRCIAADPDTSPAVVPVPPYPIQYQPFSSEFKGPTHGPYAFVPEPAYFASQMVPAAKEIRPVRSVSCATDTPPELEPNEDKEEAFCQGPPPICSPEMPRTSPPLSVVSAIRLRNAKRAAQARARGKLLRRAAATIYDRQRLLQPEEHPSSSTTPEYTSWRYRRHVYRLLRCSRFKSRSSCRQSDKNGRGKRRRTRIIYKIKRRRYLGVPEGSECPSKVSVPPEMKKIMVNKALGETVLHRAARLGYAEVVAYCLETNTCPINCQDNAGYTPLHECCSRGNLDIARALLQYGADVNASAAGGIRPIHDAVENDHVEVVRLLLSYGADPSIATYSGLTPLKLARSALMAEFLQGFIADVTGEMENRPYMPWKFRGSSMCLDPEVNGYDVFDGVPSDGEQQLEGEGEDDFLFEVSDSPHLPTFKLALPLVASVKAQCNYLRLSDVLRKLQLTKDGFLQLYPHIDVLAVPRRDFEASATCSQLLTGTKLDCLLANREQHPDGLDPGHTVELVRLDNNVRKVLRIETISVR